MFLSHNLFDQRRKNTQILPFIPIIILFVKTRCNFASIRETKKQSDRYLFNVQTWILPTYRRRYGYVKRRNNLFVLNF